ncbi:hypothetical protein ASE49_09175 [Novosphingobium sp. Leaf2]|nr:hypothetical protein ASE49_09175 [Novosphingobium sp. Leaf2]
MRNRLAFMLTGAFIGMLPFFLFKNLPASNKDIITYMVGQLSGMALMALGHYFTNRAGQDALDEKRADNTGKLADAVVAATGSGPALGAQAAASAAQDVAEELKP